MSKNFDEVVKNLPPFIARKEVGKYLGGIISPKTLANHDSLGRGPEGRFRVGRTVVYPTEGLIKWLLEVKGNATVFSSDSKKEAR